MFWYSTPSLIKEWEDLVLEHGFAYGAGGNKLRGKSMMLAVTAAGDDAAYTTNGYQHYPIRTFLTPLERTARLCHMRFSAPYLLYGALRAPDDGRLAAHVAGYRCLLEAVRDDRFDFDRAEREDVLDAERLPILEEV
jgi:glutathione-regulated potassium-efflux system ancillary protein KefG